jgi:hypothetical protein
VPTSVQRPFAPYGTHHSFSLPWKHIGCGAFALGISLTMTAWGFTRAVFTFNVSPVVTGLRLTIYARRERLRTSGRVSAGIGIRSLGQITGSAAKSGGSGTRDAAVGAVAGRGAAFDVGNKALFQCLRDR